MTFSTRVKNVFFTTEDDDLNNDTTEVKDDIQTEFISQQNNHWKTFLKFIGPGALVAVGYFDPGNWATSIESGSKYAYKHLFVILLSSLIAILFQTMCIRLGVVSGLDLAQMSRKVFPKWLNYVMYFFAEIAIMATDLAEVIGTAIALNLLFKLPLLYGVLLTCLDALFILKFWTTKYKRIYEFIVLALVLCVGISFGIQLGYTKPSGKEILKGLVMPTWDLVSNGEMLFLAISILGATVMPHNLYLHASIVKQRRLRIGRQRSDSVKTLQQADSTETLTLDEECQPLIRQQENIVKETNLTIRYATLDTILSLTLAFLINSTILIVGASALYNNGDEDVSAIPDAYESLKSRVGLVAAWCFGLALLASGQSSTITGTMAGQIIMSGFLNLKLKPIFRRLFTRLLAILPALIVVLLSKTTDAHSSKINDLLLLSQVVLSLQLPFVVIPLVYFSSSKKLMTVESDSGPVDLSNGWIMTCIGWLCAALVIGLNCFLVYKQFFD